MILEKFIEESNESNMDLLTLALSNKKFGIDI